MRLSELKPIFGRVYDDNKTPANHMGGEPTDMAYLNFICPSCGSPYIIGVTLAPEVREAPKRCWKADPMPMGPDWEASWIDRVTITPSIDYTHAGHGRRQPKCSFHGTIINGEIHLS